MIPLNSSCTSCSKFLILSSKFHDAMEIQFRADALEDQLKTKQLIAQSWCFPIPGFLKKVKLFELLPIDSHMATNVFTVVQSSGVFLTAQEDNCSFGCALQRFQSALVYPYQEATCKWSHLSALLPRLTNLSWWKAITHFSRKLLQRDIPATEIPLAQSPTSKKAQALVRF